MNKYSIVISRYADDINCFRINMDFIRNDEIKSRKFEGNIIQRFIKESIDYEQIKNLNCFDTISFRIVEKIDAPDDAFINMITGDKVKFAEKTCFITNPDYFLMKDHRSERPFIFVALTRKHLEISDKKKWKISLVGDIEVKKGNEEFIKKILSYVGNVSFIKNLDEGVDFPKEKSMDFPKEKSMDFPKEKSMDFLKEKLIDFLKEKLMNFPKEK